jgi:hypothetical protein
VSYINFIPIAPLFFKEREKGRFSSEEKRVQKADLVSDDVALFVVLGVVQ